VTCETKEASEMSFDYFRVFLDSDWDLLIVSSRFRLIFSARFPGKERDEKECGKGLVKV
jgi:predicted nucleotidyltransferase